MTLVCVKLTHKTDKYNPIGLHSKTLSQITKRILKGSRKEKKAEEEKGEEQSSGARH